MKLKGAIAALAVLIFVSSTQSASAATCVHLTYTLSFGSRNATTNGEVSLLQQFLGVTPVTGYFGPITQAAVQNWQAANGIISYGTPYTTGYGVVGPRTRRAMDCTSSTTTGSTTTSPPVTQTPTPTPTPAQSTDTSVYVKVTIAAPSMSISYNGIPAGSRIVLIDQDNGMRYTLISPSNTSGTQITMLPAAYSAGAYVVQVISNAGVVVASSGAFLLNGP